MKYDIPDFELHENTSHTKVYNRVPEGSDVLEFGCATGYMTKAFRELKGCRVWCTEIDPEGAEAASQFAEEVLVGDVETYEWAERLAGMKFDRIIFADVLEHLRRPDLILTRAKEFLTPGGSIVLSVPNTAHNAIIIDLLLDKFEYHSLGLLDNTHIHLFTKTSLDAMLEEVGLHPVCIDATYAPVWATEFSCGIADVPGIDPSFWTGRPFGCIYQYVYEVSPTKPAEVENKLEPFSGQDELPAPEPQPEPAPKPEDRHRAAKLFARVASGLKRRVRRIIGR